MNIVTRLIEEFQRIESLELKHTRGTSPEFAVKRLSEACAIARDAIQLAKTVKKRTANDAYLQLLETSHAKLLASAKALSDELSRIGASLLKSPRLLALRVAIARAEKLK